MKPTLNSYGDDILEEILSTIWTTAITMQIFNIFPKGDGLMLCVYPWLVKTMYINQLE